MTSVHTDTRTTYTYTQAECLAGSTCSVHCLNWRLWHAILDSCQEVGSTIRESVDSLCRDGANVQYMQYLNLMKGQPLCSHDN